MKKVLFKSVTVVLLGIILSFLAIPKSAQASTLLLDGAWLGKWVSQDSQDIENYSNLIGRTPGVIHTFVNTNQPFGSWSSVLNYADSKGAVNLVTIEPKKAK